jgi:hypothetical protein
VTTIRSWLNSHQTRYYALALLALVACSGRAGLAQLKREPDSGFEHQLAVDGPPESGLADDGSPADVAAEAGDSHSDVDSAGDSGPETADADDAGPDDTKPDRPETFDGGDGTYVVAPVGHLDVTPDCSGVPPSLFSMRYGCLHIDTSEQLAGNAHVCFADPKQSTESGVVRCLAPTAAVTCSPPDRLFSGRCCSHLPGGLPGRDIICGDTPEFGDFAAGALMDTDGDFVPDIDDNCILVPNTDQQDSLHNGIGDACRADAGPG